MGVVSQCILGQDLAERATQVSAGLSHHSSIAYSAITHSLASPSLSRPQLSLLHVDMRLIEHGRSVKVKSND